MLLLGGPLAGVQEQLPFSFLILLKSKQLHLSKVCICKLLIFISLYIISCHTISYHITLPYYPFQTWHLHLDVLLSFPDQRKIPKTQSIPLTIHSPSISCQGYNGTQESPKSKTIRNPCLCQINVLEGPTKNNTPLHVLDTVPSIMYLQPTTSENPYAFQHVSLLTQGLSAFANIEHFLSTTSRELISEGLRYVLTSLLKKQISKILMHNSRY